ncbi:MAG: alpha-glucan family phosphorylase [Gemmataceae bacterium]
MASRSIRTFTVLPQIPTRLQALHRLAYNVWMTWNPDAIALFRRIDSDLWEAVDHSPVRLLGAVDQNHLEALQNDDGFLSHMERVEEEFDAYLNASTWYQEECTASAPPHFVIAYFSAEFGLHESVPVYSGGLGVLSGDHLKSASDLGLPLVGVGLMYREGYFRQYLTVDGWQQERYPENDFFNMPLVAEHAPDGSPLVIGVPFPQREVFARVWRLQVGRIPLYLLDTNIARNSPEDRLITARLYGGDHDMRIRQEIMLGIGGLRALQALGKSPTVCHMNEGHSAFCVLERIRSLMESKRCDFATAREAISAGTVFTTHTPVPAGNDVFSPHLIEHYFAWMMPQLHLDRHEFLGLGRQNPSDHAEPFGMTVLALRLANLANGVSKLHGAVSRKMWRLIWPNVPDAEIPITSITNGIHTRTWVSPDLAQLFDRYLSADWHQNPQQTSLWKRVDAIPDAELWRTHERRRERLVSFARMRLKKQLAARNALPAEMARADEVLDPDALTIGFARRFATYKRGNLIFRSLERLQALLNHKERPVQFIFAGKAHPRDHGGKELIAEILQFARRPEFRRRIVFLEDYDMNIARYMLQGVDIWLNNPRRPLEASGTSGMKAAVNGGLNLSILDGWWCEGYHGDNGWAIGAGEEYTDLAYQDDLESRAIYDLLEQEIVPLFYTRGNDGLPRGWIKRMKRAIASLSPVYSTGRMVAEYTTMGYLPSGQRHLALLSDDLRAARGLAEWRRLVGKHWSHVKVAHVEAVASDPLHVGHELQVRAHVQLGGLSPAEVQVQLFHGLVDNMGEIPHPGTLEMSSNGSQPEHGVWLFQGTIPCRVSGQHGFTVRVLPRHQALANPFEPGLLCWG